MAKESKPPAAVQHARVLKGHGAILVAVGPERYEVAYVETEGPPSALKLTSVRVPYPGKGDKMDGVSVPGDSIHVALQNLNVVLTKFVREASKLWRR